MNEAIGTVGLFFAAVFLAYRHAYVKGVNSGLAIGLAIFKRKLNPRVYQSICLARVAEIDALLARKDGAK